MINAGIAQLVEQLICNHQVPSSNLGAGTIKINGLQLFSYNLLSSVLINYAYIILYKFLNNFSKT